MLFSSPQQPTKTPKGRRFLVIHGHFYQPPRENPFLGEIEGESSAYPYNDWNERITHECYSPLSVSRILDPQGRVEEIVNCYRLINFNIGPTLFAWMDRHRPELVKAIVRADEESRELNGGRGNAIAQVYNHIIMPLANERDRRTQIEWGLADFRRRFGRESESIWLAETAINEQVLELLVDLGMTYVILSPHQVESVVDPRTGKTESVATGSVDPRRPYLLKTKNGSIAAFFYDGGLASAVSFEHLLRSSDNFSARLIAAAGEPSDEDLLVNVATDGEIYGHHEPFGDMCLSYTLTRLLPNQGFTVTNYGRFLETHPPAWEAKLKGGPKGEGTAWSCSHGVGRWYRDCGCSTGAGPGWNQRWRTPLREALNTLRDRLALIYEREGSALFKEDPWQIRDDYITVIQAEGLEREEQARNEFLDRVLRTNSDERARSKALALLESQRNALLMFTSCGWFFADISGIETVQIMKYAARAADVLSEWIDENLESDFLRRLKEAESNLPQQKNGAECYKRYVQPIKETDRRVANQAVHLHHLKYFEEGRFRQYAYAGEISFPHSVEREEDHEQIRAGRVRLTDLRIRRARGWHFVIARFGELKTHAFLLPVRDGEDPFDDAELKRLDLSALSKKMVSDLGGVRMSLKDLIKRERNELTSEVLGERALEMRYALGELANQNEDLLKLLQETKTPLPEAVRRLFEITLSASLVEILDSPAEAAREQGVAIVEQANELGLTLSKEQVDRILNSRLNESARQIKQRISIRALEQMAEALEFCDLFDVHPDFSEAQNVVYELVWSHGVAMAKQLLQKPDEIRYGTLHLLLRNAGDLNLNVDRIERMISPLEREFSETPDFWP